MRKLLLFMLIGVTFVAKSQIELKDGEFTQVIAAEGLSSKEINQKTKEWISTTYKSAQDVVQLDTPDKIIVKGKFNLETQMYGYPYSYLIDHILTISFKDGRFKVDLTTGNFTHSQYSGLSFPTPSYYYSIASKEDYLNESIATETLNEVGPKMIERIKSKYGDQLYAQYQLNFTAYNRLIEEVFFSLSHYVNTSSSEDDDW